MIFRVEWRPGAARSIEGIPARDAQRIAQAVRTYAETGFGDVRRLKGRPGQCRLRAGDYRVLFTLDYASQSMVIQDVGHRRDVYRD